ncbi:MAG: ribbon-helix-helix protein, CopG family [Actinomycetota bacterium]|nr:ribbon-helix-helix protein, CopG family [Actinomycetota bacterium]
MANLTLAVDEDLLRRARVRAAEQGTSVNAIVRDLLNAYAADDRAIAARRRLVGLSVSSAAGSGGRDITVTGAQ